MNDQKKQKKQRKRYRGERGGNRVKKKGDKRVLQVANNNTCSKTPPLRSNTPPTPETPDTSHSMSKKVSPKIKVLSSTNSPKEFKPPDINFEPIRDEMSPLTAPFSPKFSTGENDNEIPEPELEELTIKERPKQKNLFQLVKEGNVEEVNRILADNTLNLYEKSLFGTTFIHVASMIDDIPRLTSLLRSGHNVNTLANDAKTPLHFACIFGKVNACNVLIMNRANINAQDIHGWTPLHYAVKNRLIVVASSLVLRGVNKNIYNKQGKRPIDIAIENNFHEIIQML